MLTELVIGTRRSPLARTQTAEVQAALAARYPELRLRERTLVTAGDRAADRPWSEVGGPGVFARELETQLLAGAIGLAVHSLKDLPVALPAGLVLGAILERGPAADVVIGPATLDHLPPGARVGTGSLRRVALLRRRRPDLVAVPLRGNVETRLAKLDRGECEALILAQAGLARLGLAGRIVEVLPPTAWLPAPGQGALAVEIRAADAAVAAVVGVLNHPATAAAVAAERAVLAALGGGCHVPVGAYAWGDGLTLTLTAMVCGPAGRPYRETTVTGPATDAARLGQEAARELLARGAADLLQDLNRA